MCAGLEMKLAFSFTPAQEFLTEIGPGRGRALCESPRFAAGGGQTEVAIPRYQTLEASPVPGVPRWILALLGGFQGAPGVVRVPRRSRTGAW